MQFSLHKKSFTLIEMLIVIVIIGILAAALIPRLQSVQGRARDTKRITELTSMNNALSIYYLDNQTYPLNGYITFPYLTNTGYVPSCGFISQRCDLENALSPYITNIPYDVNPLVDRRFLYKFYSAWSVKMYGLRVILESAQTISKQDGGYQQDQYELGELTPYCMGKYTGANARWDTWD